ncbi:MAG: ABZJ_00895 family protein [Pseudomonas sp.]|uniref:ABZJ_00895 family protein n=1 Tax=Halopseudomonas laoshanensis TaxID=2268758 RepID=UPI001B72977D|nr:ABZJ_00895 family protein [Pseudomonas sp.]
MTRMTPLKKYLFIFGGANLGLMVIAAVVFALLDLEGNAGVNMGILIGSAMAAGHYFLKDHQRLPTAAEKRWLVFMSFLASVLVSLLFVLAVVAMQPESVAVMRIMLQENAVVFLVVMLVVSLVYLLVLWLGYGFMLDRQFRAMQKKAASDRSS